MEKKFELMYIVFYIFSGFMVCFLYHLWKSFKRSEKEGLQFELNWEDPEIVPPPDELVQVIDSNGRMGYAFPCYYPFKLSHGDRTKQNPTGLIVTPCTPYWDGSWMVSADADFNCPVDGIIGWRKIPSKPEKPTS